MILSDKLKRLYFRRCLEKVTPGILNTAPIKTSDSGVVIFSQMCHRDIETWLIAIKSLYVRMPDIAVCILNDGSLTCKDIELLKHHVKGLEVKHIADVDMTDLPKGGTWERLVTLIELSQNRYAIQMDADIVVINDVPEVITCVNEQTAFVLTNYKRPGIVSFKDVSDYTRKSDWADIQHVQVITELALSEFESAGTRKYSRSSSAFTGIPPGVARRDELVTFHKEAYSKLGDKWLEWGSEQVSSNYIIANLPSAIELPCPKYANALNHLDLEHSSVLHFFGTIRFLSSRYADTCLRIIKSLPHA